MNRLIPYLSIITLIFFTSCGNEKEKSDSSSENENSSAKMTNSEIDDMAEEQAKSSKISGYATIEELSKEVVASIEANDYEDYLQHVMTVDMETTVANEIEQEEKRDYFLGEFGFSLEREKEEFENMVKYLNDREVSLDSIDFDEVEVIDYHHDDYAPLNLKEVVIVVPHKYDILLIYTAIKIKDRWYLTSELEV